MPIVRATPYTDDSQTSRSDEDGKGETAPIPELKAGARYVYYRLYTKDGPLESNNPIYSNDRYISRISSKLVRPPHTTASLKKYLCKIEGLGALENCTLYQSLSEQTSLENSTRLSFRGTPGPGLSHSDPIALVVDASSAEKRTQAGSTMDQPNLLERNYDLRYVHYFIYDEDGGAVSKASFDENTTSLGRINTLSIPPPHTVSSLKDYLIKSEEIVGHNVQLFEDDDNDSPMNDSDPISLLADRFPGFIEDQPIAIVYESHGLGIITVEDPNEILARDPQKARFALEELQKLNEMHEHELAQLREELNKAKDTHVRELAEKREELNKAKDTHLRELAEKREKLKKAKDTHARELDKVKEELGKAKDTHVRKLAEKMDELGKAKDTHARELAEKGEELVKANETHARELQEARSALDRLKKEKTAIQAALRQGASLAQVKAVMERPSFTTKLKVLQDNDIFDDDPTWHRIRTGDIFFTDGIKRTEKISHRAGVDEWGCYLGISSSGKLAFADGTPFSPVVYSSYFTVTFC